MQRGEGDWAVRGWLERLLVLACASAVMCAAFLGEPSDVARATQFRPFVGELGFFSSPQGIGVDASMGDFYVIDVAAQTVSKYGADLAPRSFSALGTNVLDGAGAGNCPAAPADCDQTPANDFAFDGPGAAQVAVDNSGGIANGDIYVTDSLHHVVDVFASTGSYLGQLTAAGGSGFGEVCGIAVDAAGALYVGDITNDAVHKFLPTGSPPLATDLIADFTTTQPCELAAGSHGTAGSLLVNRRNSRVSKIDATSGTFAYNLAGPLQSRGVAVDGTTGHVITVNSTHASEIDASGASSSLLFAFGNDRLSTPGGIGIDATTGRAYVSDVDTGKVEVFGPLTIVPNVTTGSASNVQETTAALDGTVNPDGAAATWQFEYGTTTAYGSSAPLTPGAAGSGSSDVPVSASLSGLEPGTTYHYRLTATSAGGTTPGADATFTTAGPPEIRSELLFHGEQTTATIGGRIYPGLRETSYRFEYGADTGYGRVTPVPDGSIPAGAGLAVVHADLTGLQPGATYHWRLVATNRNGTAMGPDRQFQTEGPPSGDGVPRPPVAVDGRGYELVSQADKDGSQTAAAIPAADGDSVLYALQSGGAPDSTAGVAVLYAQRTPSGWVSRNALPPRDQMPFANYYPSAASPDLTQWIAGAKDGIGGSSGSPGSALARLDVSGGQTLLQTFVQRFDPQGISVVTSDDLAHVFAIVPEPFDPSHMPGTSDVYDFGGPTPVLVSAMPATGRAPACGLRQPADATIDFPDATAETVSEHWASVEGSRVFFSTAGAGCGGPRQLYMRDVPGASTTLVSGPPVAGDPDLGVDRFLQATPDGSQAFFRSATSYTTADDADGDSTDMDIYRWTAANGQLLCVSCQIPHAAVPPGDTLSANAVVAEDGSRVYFPSSAQGADAPGTGSGSHLNLYVWRAADWSVHFVAQLDVGSDDFGSRASEGGAATPDGAVLVLRSGDPSLDALSASENGGFHQYYRYDDRDRSLTCISCPPGGPATSDVPATLLDSRVPVMPRVRAVTDDGSIVFFTTSDALVPQDVDRGPDIYEWHDGVVKLITSGRFAYPGGVGPAPLSVSAGGRDFFFSDIAPLTPDVRDSSTKIYDARVGGGFAPVAPPAECEGDRCQGPPSAPPAIDRPGSGLLRGPGNARTRRAPSFAVTRLSSSQRSGLARRGRAVLVVRVSGAGRVSAVLFARLGGLSTVVARASRRASRRGSVRLELVLAHRARVELARAGHLRMTVLVRFSRVAAAKRLTVSLEAAGHGR